MALILLPGMVFADGKISLRLQGGWTYISGGDVNHGTQAFFDYNEARWPASTGGYRVVHNGYEFGGDIVFKITSRLGVGVGGGYLQISRASSMYLDDPEIATVYAGVDAEPRLSAVPLRASIHLTAPLSTKFNFHADVGTSYYLNARYSDEWFLGIWTFEDLSSYIHSTTRAQKNKTPIGFQGGIGLEYELRHELFVYLDARGRYARFSGWHGSSVLESNYETPVSEHGILYYESVPMLTGSPRLIMVQSSPPDGPGGEPRQAVVDFSGLSLQIGIRIRL